MQATYSESVRLARSSRQRRALHPCPHCGTPHLVRHDVPFVCRPLRWLRLDVRAYVCLQCDNYSLQIRRRAHLTLIKPG